MGYLFCFLLPTDILFFLAYLFIKIIVTLQGDYVFENKICGHISPLQEVRNLILLLQLMQVKLLSLVPQLVVKARASAVLGTADHSTHSSTVIGGREPLLSYESSDRFMKSLQSFIQQLPNCLLQGVFFFFQNN